MKDKGKASSTLPRETSTRETSKTQSSKATGSISTLTETDTKETGTRTNAQGRAPCTSPTEKNTSESGEMAKKTEKEFTTLKQGTSMMVIININFIKKATGSVVRDMEKELISGRTGKCTMESGDTTR